MEGLLFSTQCGFVLLLELLSVVVEELLSNDQSPRLTVHRLQDRRQVCLQVIGLVAVLFLSRLVQSVRSQLYARREKQVAETLAVQIKKKCHLIDKLYAARKEYAEMEAHLESGGVEKGPFGIPSFPKACRKARNNSMLKEELAVLVGELKEQRSKCSKNHEEMEEFLSALASLEQALKRITSKEVSQTCPAARTPVPATPPSGQAWVIKQCCAPALSQASKAARPFSPTMTRH